MIYKKNIKSFLNIIFILTVLIQLLFFTNIALMSSNSFIESPAARRNPNSSSNGITINTPENKTYTKKMSGYYPATYGFENDVSWEVPTEWVSVYAYDVLRYAVVKDNFNDHNKVLDFWCNWYGNHASIYQEFENGTQEYGTIEFWVIEDIHYNFFIELRYGLSASSQAISISMDRENNNKFEYYNGTYHEFASGKFSTDKWFHMRIDFECSSSGYQGLSPDHFHIYLDGIKVVNNAPFWRSADALHNIIFTTGYNSGFVVDAVGYSWDPNYNIGDNLYEGLLLSFSSQEELDWMGYSLDGYLNKTILGNSSIQMPEAGIHTIQVFANDTMGDLYESNLQYFTVDLIPAINIITPENKTYTEGMEGYYHGTIGFESDKNEEFPLNWQDNPPYGNSYAKVIPEYQGHKKILKVYSEGAGDYEDIQQFFGESRTNGTIEFWIRFPDNSKTRFTHIKGTETNMIYIEWGADGTIRTYDGSTFDEMTTYSGNQWYHVKIRFEAPSEWTFYLNQNKIGTYDFRDYPYYLASLQLVMDTDDVDNYIYFDALGYSWDPFYEVGDNYEEGIHVSFETVTIFDWMGYSLDSEVNWPITGNFTIPFSKTGHHILRIYALDAIGTSYKSEFRDFCIKYCKKEEVTIPGINLMILMNLIWITLIILIYKKTRTQT